MKSFIKGIFDHKIFVLGLLTTIALIIILFFPGVPLEKWFLENGKSSFAAREYEAAVANFERVVNYASQKKEGLEAARLGGDTALFQLKDYPKAIFFLRFIVRNSMDFDDVKGAQKKLAEIYYEKLTDYQQAIVEYQRLLQTDLGQKEKLKAKIRVARSYFYEANFNQAISEVEKFLREHQDPTGIYEMALVKANALMAQKNFDQAIETFKQVKELNPTHPEGYKVNLNMASAYEQKGLFDVAMATLKEIRDQYPHPDVIDLKIKSIRLRKEKKIE